MTTKYGPILWWPPKNILIFWNVHGIMNTSGLLQSTLSSIYLLEFSFRHHTHDPHGEILLISFNLMAIIGVRAKGVRALRGYFGPL